MQNNDEFRRRFSALIKRVGDKADNVVRKTAMQLGTSFVMRSPVDSGRFRANWMYGVALNTDTTTDMDTSGNTSLYRINSGLEGWKAGQSIFLTNSLPYAFRLEYGWSQQAPSGMVRLTVAEFSTHLAKAAQETK